MSVPLVGVPKSLSWVALFILIGGFPGLMRSQQAPEQPLPGSVSGTIVDGSGASVGGAKLRLSFDDHSVDRDAVSDADGEFSFLKVAPGPFQLTVSAQGFAPQTISGIVGAGQMLSAPQIVLAVATLNTDVEVTLTRVELAQEQINVEEKQRLLGVIPNYLVTYLQDAVPLTVKQKFELSWKTTVDPVSFGLTAITAGVQQKLNSYSGYGQGAEGYAKRFGASYTNFVTGTMISSAILPTLFKQDPRYFVKGHGSKPSRFLYAVANAAIRKGDNGRWQPDYSGIIGALATGGLSNLYYPPKDRSGASLTFKNALIGVGETAIGNVVQEFFLRKLTPKASHVEPAKP